MSSRVYGAIYVIHHGATLTCLIFSKSNDGLQLLRRLRFGADGPAGGGNTSGTSQSSSRSGCVSGGGGRLMSRRTGIRRAAIFTLRGESVCQCNHCHHAILPPSLLLSLLAIGISSDVGEFVSLSIFFIFPFFCLFLIRLLYVYTHFLSLSTHGVGVVAPSVSPSLSASPVIIPLSCPKLSQLQAMPMSVSYIYMYTHTVHSLTLPLLLPSVRVSLPSLSLSSHILRCVSAPSSLSPPVSRPHARLDVRTKGEETVPHPSLHSLTITLHSLHSHSVVCFFPFIRPPCA